MTQNKTYILGALAFILFCAALILGWRMLNRQDVAVIDERVV